MSNETADISDTLAANSDQLCNEELAGGPVVLRVERVTRTADPKQPISIHLSGGYKPWRPSVGLRRALVQHWGRDANEWAGRLLRLFRDPTVTAPDGKVSGGTRISGMSHIPGPIKIVLRARTRVIASYDVEVLRAEAPPTLDAIIDPAGITRAQVAAWLEAKGRPPLTAETEAKLAGWFAADPSRLDQVRA